MFKSVLRARPFDSEEECLDAVLKHKVQKGDAVFIRYEGPKGSGMPEMFYTSEAISSDKELGKSIAPLHQFQSDRLLLPERWDRHLLPQGCNVRSPDLLKLLRIFLL